MGRKKKKGAQPEPEISTSTTIKKLTASMAERSSGAGAGGSGISSSNNGSWSPIITNIALDHLFSILLLLPADSILSFAMTCKRFKSLAYSDTLWESICKRDWWGGHTSVEAIKSAADSRRQLPWMELYRQVYQLDSVSCLALSDPDGDDDGDGMVFPRPRASHSLNVVSGCLVLFGGGCEGGRHLDDTWVAYIGNDFKRTLNWQKINSGMPSGRFGHSCVVVGDSIVLFGGINDHGVRQNDTWVGQVVFHETVGITLSWRLLDVGSTEPPPPPRGAHAGCCIDNKKMLIHGGIGLSGLRLGDTWVLNISENFLFGTWHEIVTHPSPPARSGHTLTYIGGNQTVVFGGRGSGYDVLNDVWLFDSSEEGLRWLQFVFELGNIPEGVSLPRVGHSATLVLGGRLLIYGGEDSYRHRKDDFWVLDISSIPSIKMRPNTPKQNMWRRLKSRGYKPNGRSFHQACADHSGRYLYVFGGMVDGLIQPLEPAGMRFDGELFLVELVLQL